MTTAGPAAHSSNTRHERRTERRRLVREELLAVAILLAVFLVTVLLLALQWLHPSPGGREVGAPAPIVTSVLEVA